MATDDIEVLVKAFGEFVGEVHQDGGQPRRPFPWQADLVRSILAEGKWPDNIDVPTGLGKTATLDVAVFLAGVRPDLACVRRRIFFVVDRRIVVDEAYSHADKIAGCLEKPRGPQSKRVADALRQPGDDGPVLSVTRMRGGTTWDWLWLSRPDRFAIITGTVDQIGSRFLFRGYSVSPALRPIDAALVGTDSLLILDEAHLAEPFVTTLEAALAMDSVSPLLPAPLVVSMTATPIRSGPARKHTITKADEEHPEARKRLWAQKQAHLVEIKPPSRARAQDAFAQGVKSLALSLATPGRVLGVVVNTVARARHVHTLLDSEASVEAILLIGRSRTVDREWWMVEHYPRVKVGRESNPDRPLIVVATQTVEVGANIDFDDLITESAPLPSLTQRIGRLNRLGRREGCRALIVHDASADKDDPVYGPSRQATWDHLANRYAVQPYQAGMALGDGFSVSPMNLRDLANEAPDLVRPASPYTPVLFPVILDSWVRTSPVPVPDTPIEPYLHGICDSSPQVTVLWRSGLADLPRQKERWIDVIDPLPPSSDEGIEISLAALRRWLGGQHDEITADVDVTYADAAPEEPRGGPVLVWRSAKEATLRSPSDVRPGDTVIVPVEYGGCDQYGWHPASTEPVLDVADLVHRTPRRKSRRAAVLRIGPTLDALAAAFGGADLSLPVGALRELARNQLKGEEVEPGQYQRLLRELSEKLSDPRQHPLQQAVLGLASGRLKPVPWSVGRYITVDYENDPRPWDVMLASDGLVQSDDDTELGSSALAVPIGLDEHQLAVSDRALEFANNLRLAVELVEALSLAGRWHDEGKRDPRFQAMLHRGDRLMAEIADRPLAKSGMDPADRAAFRRARERAGYPKGMRHEEFSVRIAARRLVGAQTDVDLVLHLIAAHHGHGRPLMPLLDDPQSVDVEVEGLGKLPSHQPPDWTSVDRFVALNKKYGRWGLALLEAIVRLADIWASARNEGAEDGSR